MWRSLLSLLKGKQGTTNSLGEFIASQVESAENDFRSFRDRSISLVSVAGGLVTVLVGLLALGQGSEAQLPPTIGPYLMIAAILLLILSAIFGIIIQIPVNSQVATVCALTSYVMNNWNDNDWDKRVAEFQIAYLKKLRNRNRKFARNFLIAVVCQLLAVVVLAILAWIIIFQIA